VLLGAEADHWRFDVPKLLGIALAGLGVAGQCFENLPGDWLLNAADIGFGLFGPDDVPGHRLRLLPHLVPVGHGQAQLRENVLVRNRLVVPEPFIGFGDGLAFGMTRRPAVHGVGELCAAYEKDCKFFVITLLNSGMARERSWGTARDLVEQYPKLRELAIAWCEFGLKNGGAEFGFASEMQDRVKEGYAIKDDDVILSHLAPATREKIMRAYETLNREKDPGSRK